MDIKVIKPTDKHIEQMVKLGDEARQHHINILNGYFKPNASDAEREIIKQHMLQDQDHIILVAVDDDDNVFGMILGDILYKPWLINSCVGHVANFIVSGTVRRQGIGKKLMDAFIDEGKRRGAQEIMLSVYNKNTGPYSFYIEYGFEPIEQKMSFKL